MKLGLLITTYEESRKPDKLERCLTIANDPRIAEVVIVDDCSSDFSLLEVRIAEWLDKHCRADLDVHIHRNETNLGVFGNKLTAIRHAKSEWVQSIDSDNWFDKDYLDVLERQNFRDGLMFSPSFAMPNFDYRAMAGKILSLRTLAEFSAWKNFLCLANTGNQCFCRASMLSATNQCETENNQLRQPDYYGIGAERGNLHWRKVYDSADSFYFNKLWLELGGEVLVVPGLHYQHEVHEHSSWAAAPKEKDLLPLFYLLELRAMAAGDRAEYKFVKYEHVAERRCVVVLRTSYRGQVTKQWLDPHSLVVRKTLKV